MSALPDERTLPRCDGGNFSRSAIEIGARQRQPGGAALAFRRQRLEDADPAAIEADRHACKIDEPQPGLHRADLALGGGLVRQQAIVPQPRGARVVLAPALDIMNLEAISLQVRDRHSDVIEFAAGENVAADCKGLLAVAAEELAIGALRRPRDGVMQIEPGGLEQPMDGPEIARVVFAADVLEHADRRDLVELAVEAGIILQFDG